MGPLGLICHRAVPNAWEPRGKLIQRGSRWRQAKSGRQAQGIPPKALCRGLAAMHQPIYVAWAEQIHMDVPGNCHNCLLERSNEPKPGSVGHHHFHLWQRREGSLKGHYGWGQRRRFESRWCMPVTACCPCSPCSYMAGSACSRCTRTLRSDLHGVAGGHHWLWRACSRSNWQACVDQVQMSGRGPFGRVQPCKPPQRETTRSSHSQSGNSIGRVGGLWLDGGVIVVELIDTLRTIWPFLQLQSMIVSLLYKHIQHKIVTKCMMGNVWAYEWF